MDLPDLFRVTRRKERYKITTFFWEAGTTPDPSLKDVHSNKVKVEEDIRAHQRSVAINPDLGHGTGRWRCERRCRRLVAAASRVHDGQPESDRIVRVYFHCCHLNAEPADVDHLGCAGHIVERGEVIVGGQGEAGIGLDPSPVILK